CPTAPLPCRRRCNRCWHNGSLREDRACRPRSRPTPQPNRPQVRPSRRAPPSGRFRHRCPTAPLPSRSYSCCPHNRSPPPSRACRLRSNPPPPPNRDQTRPSRRSPLLGKFHRRCPTGHLHCCCYSSPPRCRACHLRLHLPPPPNRRISRPIRRLQRSQSLVPPA